MCAGGVGQHVVCGRRFHDGGRQRGQLHRAMEREQLVGARFGRERRRVMRWRCRAARCMRAAISRRRAAPRPITSRNGTGAVGRPGARGMSDRCHMRWRCRAHVVCGRRFHDGGRHAANYIAQWNGSSWSALGSGRWAHRTDHPCVCAGGVGSNLYAGGEFTTAGGIAANYIAQWNGSSWLPLGWVWAAVSSLCECAGGVGRHVVRGRRFTTAGGNPANYIAQWNGTSWSALGSGFW